MYFATDRLVNFVTCSPVRPGAERARVSGECATLVPDTGPAATRREGARPCQPMCRRTRL